ncbi:MAG: serine/threonine-protein kinase [Planctomycetota bacterium]
MSDPQRVGDYELLDELGAGAAGEVFRARHTGSGDEAAVKLLHAQTEDDIELQKRFVREVSVLERLDHPRIVRHRECGIHDGKLYLAMELVPSGTLRDKLRKTRVLPWQEACEAAAQICDALHHAHQQGVIHRDLKPANVFVTAAGEMKVGDFGLARDLQQGRLTVEGQTVGTCKYMAPEQVRGEAALTGAVDLYAVGCLLCEMLTGRPPYDGATLVEVFEKHLYAPPPSIAASVLDAPPTLDRVITVLLAKQPADRPADAAAAREMLQAVLRGEPLPGEPPPADDDGHAAAATRPRGCGPALIAFLVFDAVLVAATLAATLAR